MEREDDLELPELKPLDVAPATLVVVQNVYYTHPDQQPQEVMHHWEVTVSSDRRPYAKLLEVGPSYATLPKAFTEGVRYLVFSNTLPFRQTIPTPEEEAERISRILRVAVAADAFSVPVDFAQVPPGENYTVMPTAANLLRLCCANGTTRVLVTAFFN